MLPDISFKKFFNFSLKEQEAEYRIPTYVIYVIDRSNLPYTIFRGMPLDFHSKMLNH